ncbi:GNAT family N-acetyltransferase [Paenibacillus marinisediminis]
MYQQMYVFHEHKPILITIRSYNENDIDALIDIQRECFPPPFPEELWWNEAQIRNHVRLFPDGALCVEFDGTLIGSMTGLLMKSEGHTVHLPWAEVTDNGYIGTHRVDGDTLYVVDISVRPQYRACGIGRILMQAMYQVVVHHRLTRLLGGGRMPGYYKVNDRMTPEQYVSAVLKGELRDPVITFLLRCGRTPVEVIHNYLDDEESCNCGLLMEWRNPFIVNGIKE